MDGSPGGGSAPRQAAPPHSPAGWRQSARDHPARCVLRQRQDRKSTRLNSSHVKISYAVFCLKKKKKKEKQGGDEVLESEIAGHVDEWFSPSVRAPWPCDPGRRGALTNEKEVGQRIIALTSTR